MPWLSHCFLPWLLCFLLVTWGTCPCVYARLLGVSGTETQVAREAPAPCSCCKSKPVHEPREPSWPDSDDCPCCSSGGYLRDLPPQAGQDLPAAPPVQYSDAPPAVCARDLGIEAALAVGCQESTGPPPSGHALHACPVGIVLLLN